MILISACLVGLFAWSRFGGQSALNFELTVPLIPGILALVTLLVAAISYFTVHHAQLTSSTRLNYILILATVLTLVVTTSGMNSVFFGLLLVLLALGPFLATPGVALSVIALGVLVIEQYVGKNLMPAQLLSLALIGGLSIVIGMIFWGRDPEGAATDETPEDRSYHELASELSQVSGKSEAVINAIGDGVVALDGKGVVQLINPAAQELLGWGKGDAANLSYKSVLEMLDSKGQDINEANDPIALAINTNKPQRNDNFSLKTQSGKSFLASIAVSPVGKLGDGAIVVFRDVTNEKKDERQRAEFISTASHEMRTPVASIEGYLGLALNPQTATIDEKARDFITKAHESAEHLGRLFADLLDISKADDSRLQNDPKVVDVVPFIHDIVEGLTPEAEDKKLHLDYKPDPDTGSVEDPVKRLNPVFYANVDNDHLREIVQNLVENAIKYTPKGEVTVDVTGDQERIIVSVKDTGIGIPREDQAHLFQKFYRVDNSDTREIGGTGLGLYLCRRLAETIGGRLWVESEYKHGSTFFLELPRIAGDEAQQLIEQSRIEAEKRAEAENAEAIHDAELAHAEAAAQPAQTPLTPQTAPVQAPPAPASVVAPQTAAPTPTPVQTATAPTVQIQPAPTTPQTAVFTAAPQAPPSNQYATPRVNTPLSAIEANPNQFLARRDGQTSINIPPRQQ